MRKEMKRRFRRIAAVVMAAGILFTANEAVNYDNMIMPCGDIIVEKITEH